MTRAMLGTVAPSGAFQRRQVERFRPDHDLRGTSFRKVGRDAADGRIDGTLTDGAVDPVDLPEEAGGEAVGRAVVEIDRAAELDHLAGAHQGDAVGQEHRLFRVVGDQHGGGAGPLQHMQGFVPHLFAQPGVKAGERLVQQKHRRIGRQRPGQGHALLLTAGQGVGEVVGVAAHADLLQRFHRTAALMLRRSAGQAESDIVDDGQMREQGVILEHQTDAAPLRRHAAGIVGHDLCR